MYSKGADVLFAAAGGASTGVIEAAKENDKYVIGVDRDQNYLAPDHVITSAIKNVNQVIYSVTKANSEGNFSGGIHEFGLKEDAVGIAATSDKHLSAQLLEEVETLRQSVIDGDISVPSSQESFDSFVTNL